MISILELTRAHIPFSKMSGKKMAPLAILVVIGAVFGVQFLFGFPLEENLLEGKLLIMQEL